MFLFFVTSLSAQTGREFKTQLGTTIPDFKFTTTTGLTMQISDMKGSVILLDFFATWCGPCLKEMPEIDTRLAQKHQDKAFVVLSIGREQSDEIIKKFEDEKGYSFMFAADPDRSIYNLFAEKYIPRNLVIDARGKIVFQSTGYDHEEFNTMVSIIDDLVTNPKYQTGNN